MSERRELFEYRFFDGSIRLDDTELTDKSDDCRIESVVKFREVLPGDLSPEESDKQHADLSYHCGLLTHQLNELTEAARAVVGDAACTDGPREWDADPCGDCIVGHELVIALRKLLEDEE